MRDKNLVLCFYMLTIHFVKDAVFPPMYIVGFFVKKKIKWVCECGSLSGPSVLSHWSMTLSSCKYHAAFITTALE